MFAPRKIALCVSSWSREGALYSWAYVKQYILRTRDWLDKGPVLDETDKLYIVHVSSAKGTTTSKKSVWQAGGALTPNLEISLKRYPHEVVELSGSAIMGTFLEWAETNQIDFLVLGYHEKALKGSVSKIVPGQWGLDSTTSRTLQHTRVPLLVVRPDAALKLSRLSIQPAASEDHGLVGPTLARVSEHSSEHDIDAVSPRDVRRRAASPTRQPVPRSNVRRVGLAFEHKSAGRVLLAWAARCVLQNDDTIFVTHVSPSKSNRDGVQHTDSLRSEPNSPRSDDDDIDICAESLIGFGVAVTQQQQGDPRNCITSFAADHQLDLLLVGRSTGSRFLKAFTPGGTVSQYVVSHAVCPVLVYPHKAVPNSEGADEAPQALRQAPQDDAVKSGHAQPGVPVRSLSTSPSARRPTLASPAVSDSSPDVQEVAILQQRLRLQDREISSLKDQVASLQQQLRRHLPPPALGRLDTTVPSRPISARPPSPS